MFKRMTIVSVIILSLLVQIVGCSNEVQQGQGNNTEKPTKENSEPETVKDESSRDIANDKPSSTIKENSEPKTIKDENSTDNTNTKESFTTQEIQKANPNIITEGLTDSTATQEADFTNPESVFLCYLRERYNIDYTTIDHKSLMFYAYLVDDAKKEFEKTKNQYIYEARARREITKLYEIEITSRHLNQTENVKGKLCPAAFFDAVVRIDTNGQKKTIILRAFLNEAEGRPWKIDAFHEKEI